MAGGRWARQSYYEAIFGLANNILEDAECYMALKAHVQRVRHNVESDPVPEPKEIKNTSSNDFGDGGQTSTKITEAVESAKQAIAHADRRHSANQMMKQYGVEVLLQIISGGTPSQLAQLGAQLVALKFSRSDETEADDYSVRYLLGTEYDAQGAKFFFQKIGGSQQVPEFLSTHPNPDNRVINIEETWKCLGSAGNTGAFVQRYQEFKNSLPQ